jgi:hypothetical protein
MKVIALKILRWLTIVIALILSIDALLAFYKTVEFRSGIDNKFNFFAVLLICFVLLVVTVLTGLGALIGAAKLRVRFTERSTLSLSLGVGIIFLLTNVFSFSDWIEQALNSKSESVLICVILTSMLLVLTMDKGGFKHEVQHGLKTDETPRAGF